MALFILIVSFQAIRSFHLDSLAQNLMHLGESLKYRISTYLEANDIQEMDRFVKEFGSQIQTRITIINREGIVLADSDEDPAKMENHRARPEIFKAYSGEIGQSIRFSRTVKTEMLYIGLPVVRNGEISEVLRVSLYLEDINQLIKGLRWKITHITLLVLFVSFLLILIMYRSFSKPVSELQAASRKIAEGNFEKYIFTHYKNEFGALTESFSFMTDKVKSLFDEVNVKKKELEGILGAIEEGLAALDKDGRILFANQSFKNIVGREEVEKNYYWEVIRDSNLKNVIEQQQTSETSASIELELGHKTYQCSVSFLRSKNETILTLYDISELKKVERIKRDFILNASHELRTPLTSIKGFIETMEEDVEGTNKKYLDIIHRNVDRLIYIVRDLLMMAELEEKEIELELEKIEIFRIIEKVLKIFDQAISQKKLELSVEVSKNLPKIEGDSFKLEQMFINLIDNAVKYTEKGSIAIRCKEQDNFLICQIQDTGIGMSEEHLSRIFERFYVVDKSRSRGLGGTGLGLSIVKHIVKLHNGEIHVESSIGKGTTISIKLPVQAISV
jgi:two-component system phosphate regulon sensor histidine kinase PhoR